MVKQLGIPTWFCSFSAADRRWPEICETILRQEGKDKPDDMDWETHCRTINSNPVTACRMLENRVQHFIHDVILSPAEPIGHITDYFFRTEFQTRGWPHIHCLFWSQNAPKFDGSGDNEEFNNYIDRYITCRLPDDNDETLNEIVKSVQTHSKSHTPSCRKGRNKNCRAQEEAAEGHKKPIQQLRQLGNVYLHNREVSIMETIYWVSGMHLKNCTREVVFLPTDPQSLRFVLTLSNMM